MVKESGNQDYTEELKKLSDENEKRSTPKSILEKLKEFIKAQGGDISAIDDFSKFPKAKYIGGVY